MENVASRKKGFTLIELSIVVVIMGILAAVAAPAVFGQIEKTKRKIDVQSALELKNILNRAFTTETITFPGSEENGAGSQFAAVIISNDGINYYRGSGTVLVEGQEWSSGKSVPDRVKKLFTEADFTKVEVKARVDDGGWACYGAILYADGSTKVVSSADQSKCASATSGDATSLNSADNPIAAYIPGGAN